MNAHVQLDVDCQPRRTAPVGERRAEPRISAEVFGVGVDATMAPGVPVQIVNLSAHGALLETHEWIRPGMLSQLRLERAAADDSEPPVTLSGRVGRSWVHQLRPLTYRTVLSFAAQSPERPDAETENPRQPVAFGARRRAWY